MCNAWSNSMKSSYDSGKVSSIVNIMHNMNLSLDDAMTAVGVGQESRKSYTEMVTKELKKNRVE